jgi:hypothetical protein
MDDLMAGLPPVERLRASLPDLPTRGDGREMGVATELAPTRGGAAIRWQLDHASPDAMAVLGGIDAGGVGAIRRVPGVHASRDLPGPGARGKLVGGVMDDGSIIAYHGSPNAFDAFDSRRIGSGAQPTPEPYFMREDGTPHYAGGAEDLRGLHFAQREFDAERYRDRLAPYLRFRYPDLDPSEFDALGAGARIDLHRFAPTRRELEAAVGRLPPDPRDLTDAQLAAIDATRTRHPAEGALAETRRAVQFKESEIRRWLAEGHKPDELVRHYASLEYSKARLSTLESIAASPAVLERGSPGSLYEVRIRAGLDPDGGGTIADWLRPERFQPRAVRGAYDALGVAGDPPKRIAVDPYNARRPFYELAPMGDRGSFGQALWAVSRRHRAAGMTDMDAYHRAADDFRRAGVDGVAHPGGRATPENYTLFERPDDAYPVEILRRYRDGGDVRCMADGGVV